MNVIVMPGCIHSRQLRTGHCRQREGQAFACGRAALNMIQQTTDGC